ncbi:MAG: hypothetical protein ACXWNF_17200, partial [Isosphaeraceae bacterium]
MSALIEAPIEMVEAVAGLHLPPRADQRLQDLMNRNTTVRLTGPSHGTSSVADSCLRNSSGVILSNSQKLNAG